MWGQLLVHLNQRMVTSRFSPVQTDATGGNEAPNRNEQNFRSDKLRVAAGWITFFACSALLFGEARRRSFFRFTKRFL